MDRDRLENQIRQIRKNKGLYKMDRLENQIRQIRKGHILKFKLLPEFEGNRYFWHMYHKNGLVWKRSYLCYLSRIRTILSNKPPSQIQDRLNLFKPIKSKSLIKYLSGHKEFYGDGYIDEKVQEIHKKECKNCPYNYRFNKISKFERF